MCQVQQTDYVGKKKYTKSFVRFNFKNILNDQSQKESMLEIFLSFLFSVMWGWGGGTERNDGEKFLSK